MDDDGIRAALGLLERHSRPPEGVGDALFARLVEEIEAPPLRESEPARADRQPRLRLVPFGVAAALIGFTVTVITLVQPAPAAFATLEEARERFQRRPLHATIRNVFGEFVGDDTLAVELWFASENRWRSNILSSSNPNTPEEAGDFAVFDGRQHGRYEVEDNTFDLTSADEVDDPYLESGLAVHDPTFGVWATATGIKPTAQFLNDNCEVTRDEVAGRAADRLTCDAGLSGNTVREATLWLDRETGFILKIETPEGVREVLDIEFDPAFPEGIFDVVAPEGATVRGDAPAPVSRPAPEVSASIHVAPDPYHIHTGFGAVWIVSQGGGEVHGGDRARPEWQLQRIDPITNSVVARVVVDRGSSVAVGEGYVWIASASRSGGSLRRLDPATNDFVGSPILVETHPTGVEIGDGAVWVIGVTREEPPERGELLRIDPSTNEVTRIGLEGAPFQLDLGAGSVWVNASFQPPDVSASPTTRIHRVNVRTHRVEATIRPDPLARLAFGEGALWTLRGAGPAAKLTKIDPATNREAATVELPPDRYSAVLATGGGYVWVLSGEASTLTRVDPATERVVESIRLPKAPQSLAVGENAVWVGYFDGIVIRVDIT